MVCEINAELLPGQEEIVPLPEGMCPVDWAKRCVDLARASGCGKNVMCRDGMTQLRAILTDISQGRGEEGDIGLLRDLAGVIAGAKDCGLASRAAENLLCALGRYADEWDAHIQRRRCAALVCPGCYHVYIDPALCQGCGKCISSAPPAAVEGGEGLISVVRDDAALKMAAFFAVCPNGAIKKYGGLVKPRVPETPVPVGGFSGEEGGRRRRRRGASHET